MLWGRHDPYYQLDEIMAYSRELDWLEMHVFDGALRGFVADAAR